MKLAKVMTPSPFKIHPTGRIGRRSRSAFNYGPGSADLDCPISPLLMKIQLAWRLVSLRRRGGRAIWHGSASPKS
jgi:hypothetical protein